MDKKTPTKVAIREDLMEWVRYASALEGTSPTGYVNAAVERERDSLDGEALALFEAFKKAAAERQGG